MTRTKLNLFLIPLTFLILLCSGFLIYLAYIIVVNNISNITDPNIISGILFLTWTAIFPLSMMLIAMRNYEIHTHKLKIKYLFGLITISFDYDDLLLSNYSWSTKGILIQLSDGDQMTLGEKQYKNFNEVKLALEEKIKNEDIKIKYTTKYTRLMFLLGGLVLLPSIINAILN